MLLVNNHPILLTLALSNALIGSEGVDILTRSLPNLTKLRLPTNNIDNEAAFMIARRLMNLQHLDVSKLSHKAGTNKVGNQGAEILSRDLSRLNTLHISTAICDLGKNEICCLKFLIVATGLSDLSVVYCCKTLAYLVQNPLVLVFSILEQIGKRRFKLKFWRSSITFCCCTFLLISKSAWEMYSPTCPSSLLTRAEFVRRNTVYRKPRQHSNVLLPGRSAPGGPYG